MQITFAVKSFLNLIPRKVLAIG